MFSRNAQPQTLKPEYVSWTIAVPGVFSRKQADRRLLFPKEAHIRVRAHVGRE